jgi:hypothetical protein
MTSDPYSFPDLNGLPAVLTTEEVADIFRVCPETIMRRARRGDGLSAISGLRVGRFTRESVILALKKGKL